MGTEQQFCLRWNNHQSTLVAVFDTLLESGTLVDCTLAAEGQYLKAHKVVLSACSPYFELLLSQHYEKHPIVILKDVKFQELKAMMDYMYRGEVNISQDQLGALLKAAESLQIKGLSDSGGGGTTDKDSSDKRHERRREAPPPPPTPILPHSSGLTIEQRRPVQPAPPPVVELPEDSPPLRVPGSREGSLSPVPRKRKRHRRRSSGDDSAQILSMTESRETSSSCELPPQSQPSAPSISTPILPVVPTPSLKSAAEQQVALGQEEQTETEILPRPLTTTQANISSPQTVSQDPEPAPTPKVEPPSELLEPKSEYLEEQNEDSVEDLTLDDDMDEMDQAKPGPSHGGEGSSSQGGFAPWHVAADRSTDEVFMAAQEAVGAHRDSQDNVIMNNQPAMKGQQPGAPSGTIMNSSTMVIPNQGQGQPGAPQGQQNPAVSVQAGPQQSQSGQQPQGATPGTAGTPSQVPGQAPTGGPQPQQQQQPGSVREHRTIWQGVLEWIEKAKNPNDPQKLTRHVPCQVSTTLKDGEPELKADSWPQKLIMQLMPKKLIGSIGDAYLKNSKSVLFHPQQCEALESLTKIMSSGFAGCVDFTSMPTTASCDIKVLILLYTSEKRAYLGFIPNDQTAFVDRLRKVIQHEKTTQALIRQQGQVGNAGGNPSGAGAPQQQQLTGPMSGPATGQQSNQQQNNPQQGPQGGILMSQTNQLALGGGQITQNVVTSANQQMQQVPLGQPGGGSSANQPSPAQMQGLQNAERHLGPPGGNQQQQQQQQQSGGGGPLRGQGIMGGPPQRPPFDHIEAARQQNLAKIHQLRAALEAAQQQELQYKNQLEQEQQKQPRAQLQQQQQQQQQRQMNPQNMQPNQPQQPNQQQQ